MNEHYTEKNYWRNENIGDCYMDMLKFLEKKCRERHLSNYFNVNENILAKKKYKVLDKLADYCKERRLQLLHIKMT